MKKLIIFFSFIFFTAAIGQNKKITPKKIDTINLKGDHFIGYDSFGFYYLIKNEVLYKVKGSESFEYKNIFLGEITVVDIQNPLRIVLFYERFNTVILLDNQMNETKKINFSETPTPLIAATVGIAGQNQLWVYNVLSQQIGLYDYIKETYKTVSVPLSDTIKYFQSDFNSFYWINQNNICLSSTIFGKINTLSKIPDFDTIKIISNNQIIFSKNNILFLENLEEKEKYEIDILEKTFKNFYYKDQILSIFTSKGITNYKITTP